MVGVFLFSHQSDLSACLHHLACTTPKHSLQVCQVERVKWLLQIIDSFPNDSHPMAMLSSAIVSMQSESFFAKVCVGSHNSDLCLGILPRTSERASLATSAHWCFGPCVNGLLFPRKRQAGVPKQWNSYFVPFVPCLIRNLVRSVINILLSYFYYKCSARIPVLAAHVYNRKYRNQTVSQIFSWHFTDFLLYARENWNLRSILQDDWFEICVY